MKYEMMTSARNVGCKEIIPYEGEHFAWQRLELFLRLELRVNVWLVTMLIG